MLQEQEKTQELLRKIAEFAPFKVVGNDLQENKFLDFLQYFDKYIKSFNDQKKLEEIFDIIFEAINSNENPLQHLSGLFKLFDYFVFINRLDSQESDAELLAKRENFITFVTSKYLENNAENYAAEFLQALNKKALEQDSLNPHNRLSEENNQKVEERTLTEVAEKVRKKVTEFVEEESLTPLVLAEMLLNIPISNYSKEQVDSYPSSSSESQRSVSTQGLTFQNFLSLRNRFLTRIVSALKNEFEIVKRINRLFERKEDLLNQEINDLVYDENLNVFKSLLTSIASYLESIKKRKKINEKNQNEELIWSFSPTIETISGLFFCRWVLIFFEKSVQERIYEDKTSKITSSLDDSRKNLRHLERERQYIANSMAFIESFILANLERFFSFIKERVREIIKKIRELVTEKLEEEISEEMQRIITISDNINDSNWQRYMGYLVNLFKNIQSKIDARLLNVKLEEMDFNFMSLARLSDSLADRERGYEDSLEKRILEKIQKPNNQRRVLARFKPARECGATFSFFDFKREFLSTSNSNGEIISTGLQNKEIFKLGDLYTRIIRIESTIKSNNKEKIKDFLEYIRKIFDVYFSNIDSINEKIKIIIKSTTLSEKHLTILLALYNKCYEWQVSEQWLDNLPDEKLIRYFTYFLSGRRDSGNREWLVINDYNVINDFFIEYKKRPGYENDPNKQKIENLSEQLESIFNQTFNNYTMDAFYPVRKKLSGFTSEILESMKENCCRWLLTDPADFDKEFIKLEQGLRINDKKKIISFLYYLQGINNFFMHNASLKKKDAGADDIADDLSVFPIKENQAGALAKVIDKINELYIVEEVIPDIMSYLGGVLGSLLNKHKGQIFAYYQQKTKRILDEWRVLDADGKEVQELIIKFEKVQNDFVELVNLEGLISRAIENRLLEIEENSNRESLKKTLLKLLAEDYAGFLRGSSVLNKVQQFVRARSHPTTTSGITPLSSRSESALSISEGERRRSNYRVPPPGCSGSSYKLVFHKSEQSPPTSGITPLSSRSESVLSISEGEGRRSNYRMPPPGCRGSGYKLVFHKSEQSLQPEPPLTSNSDPVVSKKIEFTGS